MKTLRKLYYKIFKTYSVLEERFVSWEEGDKMLRETDGCDEHERWVLSSKEDSNTTIGMVWLCRKQRIIK